jgi:molybdate transport system substrate-binding protein
MWGGARSRRTTLALLPLLALAGCGGESGDGGRPELTVLAAASLTDAYQELASSFEQEHGAEVTFVFGSSTDLAAQAADGAPGDVLSTADADSMQVAEEAGVTDEVVELAGNAMVVVTPAGNPAGIGGIDDLEGSTWVRCADAVPCGRVALSVLADHGVTAEPASLEDDARATLDKVVSGEADAGLVYATDAVAAGDDVETVEIPGAEDRPTTYYAATLAQSADPELAGAWLDLVTSREGRAVLDEAGFTLR